MTNHPIWHCPDHPASPVSRSGDRSRCDACGQTDHPMDLPGVDRVLVIGSQIRVFQDWAMSHRPDATSQTTARYGSTVYCYRSSIEQIPGFSRETTRHYSLGPFSDRTLRADDYAQELYAPAFSAPPESRQAPEPGAGFSGSVTYRNCTFHGELINSTPPEPSDSVEWRIMHGSPNDRTDWLQELLDGAGLRFDGPVPRDYRAAMSEFYRQNPATIGNPECRFNARSRFLRCAVRPEAGSCEGCSDFEVRE